MLKVGTAAAMKIGALERNEAEVRGIGFRDLFPAGIHLRVYDLENSAMRNLRPSVLFAGSTVALAAAVGLAIAQMNGSPGGWSNSANGGEAGDPRHGKAGAAAHCATCPGDTGNDTNPLYPKLAGQKAAYLYAQLWAFKQGSRPSAVMGSIVKPLSDSDLADVSAFYADQTMHPDKAADRALASEGEQIYYAGRPSCAMCHEGGGMPMMSMMGGGVQNAPRLNGQHAAYVLQQLDAYATGQRQGSVMNRVAESLSEQERKAVAEYLAGRP